MVVRRKKKEPTEKKSRTMIVWLGNVELFVGNPELPAANKEGEENE